MRCPDYSEVAAHSFLPDKPRTAAQIPNQTHIQNEHCSAESNFCSFYLGKVQAGGRKSTLRKLEWLSDYIPNMFLHVYLSRYRYQRPEDFRLFYYVAVLLADDALEEDPNRYRYKGLILNSFSNGFEFVDLGNFKPAPMQNLAM